MFISPSNSTATNSGRSDVSKSWAEAIAWAQERMEASKASADFRVGNVVDLASYPDDFFDLVFDGECLHCVIGADREACLANVFRVLKRGGLFYIQGNCMDETLKERLDLSPDVYFDPQSQCLLRNGIPYYYLSREEEILEEIQEAGFSGIAGTIWAGDVQMTSVRSNGGKPCKGT